MSENGEGFIARVRGAVLGAAVGDALALPYQHYSRAFLRSLARPLITEFATHHGGFHPAGQTSDDTREMLAAMEALTESGEASAEAFALRFVPLWRDGALVELDPSLAEPLEQIARGAAPPHRAGHLPGRAEAAACRRAVPVGLFLLHDPAAIPAAAAALTRVTHQDPRCLAASAAVAAAVAYNARTEELCLGGFLDTVAGAAGVYDPLLAEAVLDFPRTLSMSEDRALRLLEAARPDDRYPPSEEGLGPYCVPVVLTAVYYFLKAPYRYERVIESVLRTGGQMDTAAFFAGAMSGALVGETGVPERLVSGLLEAQEIMARADDLHAAWSRKPGAGAAAMADATRRCPRGARMEEEGGVETDEAAADA